MAEQERSGRGSGSAPRRAGGGRPRPRAGGKGEHPSGDGHGQGRGSEDSGARAGAPAIDEDVTGRELDKEIRHELSTLDGPVAGTVARHLVMAGRLMDSDPELAHRHTQHARALAGRVAVVREAAGYAAYESGHFDTALTEFRTARRIGGRSDFLAVMADCERGVGRPEKALSLADEPEAAALAPETRAELAIVAGGALRDLDRPEEALALLRRALPTRPVDAQWVARVQYALGDVLAEQGETADAVAAFAAAEAGDWEGSLDAGDRVVELLEP